MEAAYHNIYIETFDDGSALRRDETNDNDDDGYADGTTESWEFRWKNAETCIKAAGISRIGISGVRVNVYIDGEKV